MFREAVLRLTGWYVLLIMAISLTFSIALYRVSVQNLDRIQAQQEMVLNSERSFNIPPFILEMSEKRVQQIIEIKQHTYDQLVLFNLIILGVGAAAAWLLASRTLQPIEKAHEAQERFASDAAHELRTPLTVMRSQIEVMLRESKPSPKELGEVLKSNLEEIEVLEQLSSGLLALARYETTSDMSFKQSADLKELISGAVTHITPLAEKGGVEVKVEVEDAPISVNVWGFREVVSNLLENAVKYSPSGALVTVKARVKKSDIVVQVSDTGSGIEPSDLKHIFERFYRGRKSEVRSSGYGLGLSISERIVEAHGGSISVTSKVGVGTTFTVILPVR